MEINSSTPPSELMPDFKDTATAFERFNDWQLRQTIWLFRLMNKPWLVQLGSRATLWALRLRLPVQGMIKRTIFKQFCGGSNFEECQNSIAQLQAYGVKAVLDYGAEAKQNEAEFDRTVEESTRSIHFASKNAGVSIISCKITGLCRFELLEKVHAKTPLNPSETQEYERAKRRLQQIAQEAAQRQVALFIDAEESWIQDAIDELCDEMMAIFNREQVVVYNTFQLYRHDRLAFLKRSHELAQAGGYLLGAKLVRGAYMEKEHERAKKLGYPTPIQANKASCDRDYNEALRYCVQHVQDIACCAGTHNAESTLLLVELMAEHKLKSHKHLSFCQLYGMSDHLTFNLAKAGYPVAKYLPYGPVRDVIPYLIRRAQENSATEGEMGRELQLLLREQARRRG